MSEKLMSEHLPIVGVTDPDAYTTGTELTDAIDMRKYRKIMAIVLAGTVGTGTIDFALQQAEGATGSYATITGKEITQLTATDDDVQAIVNLQASEMTDGKTHVKGLLTSAAAGDAAVVIIADHGRFADAATSTSYGDLASVVEIVD